MKKKLILRAAVGFPVGVSIGCAITITTSLQWGNGYYIPCVPALVSMMGSEIRAVILQTFFCGLIGAGFAGSSIVWDMEDWSLIKQTGIYFCVNALIMMPIAYFMYWMEHSVAGFISYMAIFIIIFIAIWIALYSIEKHNVRKMNESLYRAQENEK